MKKLKTKIKVGMKSLFLNQCLSKDSEININSIYAKKASHFTLVMLVLFSLFSGCQDVEFPGLKCRVKSVDGSLDDVTGKWKLVRVKNFNMENGQHRELDYSCENIVYEFNEEDTVEIIGGEFEFVSDPGIYDYDLVLSPFNGLTGFTMKIGFRTWACFIESGKMTLDASGLDGEILEFVRIA